MTIPHVTHALSVREPFGWALTTGFKTVENRTWAFPARRHPLPAWIAIHTSLDWSGIYEDTLDMFGVHEDIEAAFEDPRGIRCLGRSEIVGVVRVVDCVSTDDPEALNAAVDRLEKSPRIHPGIDPLTWAADGGGYAWLIDDCYRFRTPIVCIGRLNVWNMGDVLTGLVRDELAKSVAEQADSLDRGEIFNRPLIYQMPKIPKKQQTIYA